MTAIQPVPSLARGDALTADTWNDFVARMRHDTIGERRRDHCTADAIFEVQEHQVIYGIDREYADEHESVLISCDDWEWFGPKAYWESLDLDQKAILNRQSQAEYGCKFMRADFTQQCDLLAEQPHLTVCGYQRQWVTIGTHLTYAAAEAFITRKKHDFKALRVYTASAYWAWELKAIREAILNGSLTFVGAAAEKAA
ncbi:MULTISPECIES: hypothetical protein [Pseudomonas]|uniref:hypothetical protein n=1 Tax=Pseudomonas TaxID=286 RepID=UPI000761D484|nr:MULTISPECIES: hypothetical protein [Pseudomonas]MDG9809475.1 hypothetical protein [Pseudomonas juntendi]MDG9815832.1 hypothetical protein [Pseudomonas putida]